MLEIAGGILIAVAILATLPFWLIAAAWLLAAAVVVGAGWVLWNYPMDVTVIAMAIVVPLLAIWSIEKFISWCRLRSVSREN